MPDVDEEMLQQSIKKREKEFYGEESEVTDGIEEKPGEEEDEDSKETMKRQQLSQKQKALAEKKLSEKKRRL